MKTYKQFVIKYYNNDNQLKKEYIYADNLNQAVDAISIKYNIYKARIASASWLKTVTL